MNSHVLELEDALTSRTNNSLQSSPEDEQLSTALDPKRYFQEWVDSLRHEVANPRPRRVHRSSRGEIAFDGVVNVKGNVSADIRSSRGTMFVAPSAKIDGDVHVESAIIEGVVQGDITASHLQLGETARVIGHINAAELSIQAGAVFEGHSAHLCSPVPRQSEFRSSRRLTPDEERQEEFAAVLAVA